MLNYTGHPLVDVGIATICAFSKKARPEEVTPDDLDQIADYLATEIVKSPLRSHYSIAFTSNGWFIQDAYDPDKPNLSVEARNDRLEKRDRFARNHLQQWRAPQQESTNEVDIFIGENAVEVELSQRLPPGRAGRAQVPMLLGDENINFYAYGARGLPISGKILLCLQALPLGCAKCGGRLLAVHSDSEELLLHFAQKFLDQNRVFVQVAQAKGDKKMPEPHLKYKTHLIDVLLEADYLRWESSQSERTCSVTAYYVSNSGQQPSLDIYHLPMHTVAFLRDMESTAFRSEWHAIVALAWDKPASAKEEKDFQPSRNRIYEDLFELDRYGWAARFIRIYFLRMSVRAARDKNDPRTGYSLQQESNLVSWKLTAHFLWRIMNMDREQIEIIREMADKFAGYVEEENDKHFFSTFRDQRYQVFRTNLLRANLKRVKKGGAPLLELDRYIEVFEFASNDYRPDWRLARDLVFIRMIEQLHVKGWLHANREAVEEIPEAIENESE